ncbi:helix-turn-helix domain-containing protein [Variovorax sp. J22P271]|uniref:GlxA family transcriptional regulator n=1 Tax=Variovorax davisae TaxID=3053515 RepID=UPI0025767776|nr:helix-turn-helix domain-containing protein [Variovorax sp. J22P271]MDM0033792.1 helix-turn-helix domain-containing protein [Variovorax sp. J22P271]
MIHFDLLLPPAAMPGSVWSAVDVLRQLNALARLRAPRASTPAVSWRVLDERGRIHRFHASTCVSAQERQHGRRPGDGQRVLLVPPFEGAQSVPALIRLVRRSAGIVDLLRASFDEGALLGACGTGVWLLAQTGRLEKAAMPWIYQPGFAHLFPSVRIEATAPIVAQHRILCAATPSLIHSLVLHLVGHAGAADLAHACEQTLLPNTERQQVSAAMNPDQGMGISRDTPLYRALTWMRTHAGRPFTLDEAAAAAAVSERTLSRLFRQHMDQTPLHYVQALRVNRAKMWLEGTWRSVEEIAHDCGYADASAFGRMFSRATGSSPQRWRERFSLRGPRALWKLHEAAGTSP